MAKKRRKHGSKANTLKTANYGYMLRGDYEANAHKFMELERSTISRTASDIKEGALEKCYITIGKRRVSILPFFVNAVSFIENEALFAHLSEAYAINEKELLDLVKKNECWYINNIGKENYNILKGLCGHPTRAISRYLVIGALKNFDKLYSIMTLALLSEAINSDSNGKSINEYSEGIQNTMALSYYICIKWFKDGGFIEDNKLKIDFVEEIISNLLSVPGPLQDLFNCDIDEEEFMNRQAENIDKGTGNYQLSPLYKETLEAYGINLSSKDTIRDLDSVVSLANDLCKFRTSETLQLFQFGISGLIMESNEVHNTIKERDYLKKEIETNNTTKEKQKRECKQAKRELTKANSEINRLKREVEKFKDICNKIPEETKKTLDSLYKEVFSKNNEIKELSNLRDDLRCKLSSSKKEKSSLKKQVKKLEAKLKITLDENQLYKDELDSVMGVDIDDNVPFEDVVAELEGKRIVVIGGAECIGQGLSDLDLEVKQYTVDANIGAKDIGKHDCIVFMIKYMSHTALWAAKSNVKGTDKPMIYYYGTNIEKLCRNIHREING